MRCKLIFLIIITSIFSSLPDVPFVAYREGRLLANVEILASVEPTFRHNVSLPIWTGFALVIPIQGERTSKGFELAVELRKSFPIGPHFSGFFISAYGGMAVMEVTEYYRDRVTGQAWFPGASFGIKAGYRLVPVSVGIKKMKWGVWLEPYFSVSFSTYARAGTLVSANNPLLTAGIRAVTGFAGKKQ